LWQRIIRAAVWVGVVLAVLYATLPWWLPKQFLADRVAASLGAELGLPVKIGRMTISWRDGISIEGFRIGCDESFGGGDMVVVGSMRCDFSPIRLIVEQRMRWVEMTDAELRAVINERGEVNLAALERGNRFYPPEHLTVRRARATVQLPRHDRLLCLSVSDLEYRAGRLQTLGRITMSAVLDQSGPDAPVALLASAGGAQGQIGDAAAPGKASGPVAATCGFRFAGVDIAQLNLTLLLGLPLERLNGWGSGRLDCRISRSGRVDDFSFLVRVKDLDAQPVGGPTLPVIEQAEVRVVGAYDPLTNRADIQTVRIRLPGVELEANGSMGADVLRGNLEAVQFLEMDGKVNPNTLAALCAWEAPGGLAVDGDVEVHVRLSEREQRFSWEAKLDATAARVLAGGRVVKRNQRKLAVELEGSFEKRTREFLGDRADVRIGRNLFSCRKAVENVQQLLSELSQAGRSITTAAALEGITNLDWNGSWEIVELDSLLELVGGAPHRNVELEGQILGQWFIQRGGTVRLEGVRVPAETRLSAGKWFVKPPGQPMRLAASAVIRTDPAGLGEVHLAADAGGARVSLDEAELTFSDAAGPGGMPFVEAKGRYGFRDAAALLACVPAAEAWRGRVGGDLSGEFRAILSASFLRLRVEANATQLEASVGDIFRKRAGQLADVAVDFQADASLSAAFARRLTVHADLGSAKLETYLSFPRAGTAGGEVRCAARLSVSDAGGLLQRIPAARGLLEAVKVGGSTVLSLEGRISQRAVTGELRCDADDLELTWPGGKRSKARGKPLRVRLAGAIDDASATIDLLSIDLGRSSVSLSGTVAPAASEKLPPERQWWPPPGVAGVNFTLRGRFVLDSALRALLPELDRQAKRLGLTGAVRTKMDIRGDARGLDLDGDFDAVDLAVASDKSFVKPAGETARGTFELTVPAEPARVRLRNLFLDTGAFQATADGSWPLLSDKPLEAHLAVNVPDLRRLAGCVPELAAYRPAGAVFAECELQRRGGRDWFKYITIKARNVTATYRDAPCRLDGTLLLENAELAGEATKIGRVFTDSLLVVVGKSRGYLIADVRKPTESPTGELALLAGNLDIYELQGLGGLPKPPERAGPGPVTPEDRKALTRRADRLIAEAAKLLASADLRCRVEAGRLSYFDPFVKSFYEVHALVAQTSAKDGAIEGSFRCGLNGGLMKQRFMVDLNRRPARALTQAEYSQIMASESMLAQLAQEFPGNVFRGDFNRTEEITCGLRELVMQSLDPRHRAVRVGTSTTITEDGHIRGRAAPKFMTRFFPGLNLATYRYRRMTGYAEYLPDDSARNDMIFSGANYDMFIEGTTDANRIGRYTIGLILLGTPQTATFQHRFRQGRIPVLKFKARIEGGKFYDEEVWYPLPTETAYKLFLENNIFYRLWLAARHKPRAGAIINGKVSSSTDRGG